MRKITINGQTVECDDNVEISIEGDKVTIKAARAENVVHEHHYHYVNQPIAYPYGGIPPAFPIWCPDSTITVGMAPDPPMTPGYVQIGDSPNPGLSGGTSVMFPLGENFHQVSDNLARFTQ